MALPIAFLAQAVFGLLQGPLAKVLDSYVSDLELRRKLAAELETQFLAHLGKSAELGAGVVLAEVNSEHWLTRSWRPLLMVILMGFLVLAGLVLPLAELLVGAPIRFEPRWNLLPAGFWDFLLVGMGGYIGGRSLEKVAGMVMGRGPSAQSFGLKRR